MQKNDEEKAYIETLKNTILFGNGEDLTDEELLTVILSYAPCPLGAETTVENIRSRFGSCRRAYLATPEELAAVEGVTERAATLIVLVSAFMKKNNTEDYIGKKNVDYAQMFSSCIRRSLSEELWVATLDGNGKILGIKNLSVGSTVGVSIRSAAVTHFAHITKAKAVVLAHTHPEGTTTEASYDDYESALRIHNSLSSFGIRLLGQVIICGWDAEFHEFDPG